MQVKSFDILFRSISCHGWIPTLAYLVQITPRNISYCNPVAPSYHLIMVNSNYLYIKAAWLPYNYGAKRERGEICT